MSIVNETINYFRGLFNGANRATPKGPFLDWYYGANSGTRVSEKIALGLAAYWSGIRLISESVAMLPVKVIRKDGDVRTEVDSPINKLLNSVASDGVISFHYTVVLVQSAITWGNGYAMIDRDGLANPIELINVHPEDVEIVEFDGEMFYKVKAGEDEIIVNKADMIHLKGFGNNKDYGLSLLQYHADTLGVSRGAQTYGRKLYEKGTFIDGYISMPTILKKEVKDAISSQWSNNYGINGARGTAILDGGSEYKRLGMPPADAKYVETTKMQDTQIASILRVPPHMIGIMDNATFSNIEHQQIEFVTFSLGGWIKKLEQEYHSKLLREYQKIDHQIKHTVAALLRADLAAQGEFFKTLTEIGAYSPNDVRADLDKNKVEGGDVRTIQLNRIPITQIDTYYKEQNNGSDN